MRNGKPTTLKEALQRGIEECGSEHFRPEFTDVGLDKILQSIRARLAQEFGIAFLALPDGSEAERAIRKLWNQLFVEDRSMKSMLRPDLL